MKMNRPRVQRTASVVLASALAVSLLLSPLTWGVQPVLAQAGAQPAGKIVVVGADGATLYTAPQGEEISSLPLGTMLTATQRTADTQWIAVRAEDGVEGWVQTAQIVAFGLSQLPVADAEGTASGSTGAADAATQPAATSAARFSEPPSPRRAWRAPTRTGTR